MRAELVERLGTDEFDDAVRVAGAQLDDAAATELVMTAFDAIIDVADGV